MKQFTLFLVIIMVTLVTSCSDKIQNTELPEPPADSVYITNGLKYFLDINIGDTTLLFENNKDHVGNGVFKQSYGPCSDGNITSFSSYFSYVSDTSRKERVSFGLTNCVNDTANGITDSTYYVFNFPIEIAYPDTSVAFINYIDSNSVLWSSSLGQNGLIPQVEHTFNVTYVERNLDGISNLQVKGNFTGWLYNANGDSVLVSKAEFYSRAWAL